jgi:hypothetical protein
MHLRIQLADDFRRVPVLCPKATSGALVVRRINVLCSDSARVVIRVGIYRLGIRNRLGGPKAPRGKGIGAALGVRRNGPHAQRHAAPTLMGNGHTQLPYISPNVNIGNCYAPYWRLQVCCEGETG